MVDKLFKEWFDPYQSIYLLTCQVLKINPLEPLLITMLKTAFLAGMLEGTKIVHSENLQPPASS